MLVKEGEEVEGVDVVKRKMVSERMQRATNIRRRR